MTSERRSVAPGGEEELAIADLIEAFAARLQAGESIDAEAFAAEHPAFAERLRELLPGVQVLASLEPSGSNADSEEVGAESQDGALSGVLGDFRIVREVGKGGMGIVYEAEQISLRRRVALKVLPFAATMDPRHLQRFHNEAQAAACLHHTNIVPVHFVGSERGVHFYAMQFIDGQPLSEIIRQMRRLEEKEPLVGSNGTVPYQPSPEQAASTPPAAERAPLTAEGRRNRDYCRKVAELGIQAAEALDHAHQLGIVHRDIKPGNLMLDGRGNLWVTDFGLAHMPQSNANLTLTGQALGTPRYMSPEQALAKRVPIDHRTDVYSLGVTLYELLTLRPAFTSEDRHELLRQIAFEEPVKPRRLERAIPAELEIIVLKAMEKRPQDRYATAQELADDLARWLKNEPIRARRPSLLQRSAKWGRRHRSLVAAGLVVLLLALIMLSISNVLIWSAKKETENALLISNMHRREVENLVLITSQQRDLSEQKLLKALQMINSYLLEMEEKGALPMAISDLAIEGYKNLLPIRCNSRPLELQTVWAYVLLGNLYAKCDRFAQAEVSYAQAVRLLSSRGVLTTVASAPFPLSAETAGERYDAAYQPPRALEKSFRRAVAHWRETGRGWEKIADYRIALARVTPKKLDQDEERYYQERISVIERVLADLPTLEHRSTLMDELRIHAFRLQKAGHIRETREAYVRALECGEKWESTPNAAYKRETLCNLARNFDTLGSTFCNLGAQQEAERAYRSAWILCTKFDGNGYNWETVNHHSKSNASNNQCSPLVHCTEEYGWFLEKAGRFEEAREVFRHAFTVKEKQTSGWQAGYISPVSPGDYYVIGAALADLKAPEEAERALSASLRFYERLLHQQPQNYASYYLLAGCHLKLGHLLGEARYKHAEYVSAARFFAKSLALDLKWDLHKEFDLHRFSAACAAALAGCSQGADAEKLDAEERARLRQQALDWLRADLKAYRQEMERDPEKAGPMIAQRMQHWLRDEDLADMRGSESLARLPEAERKEWQRLWDEVEALRQRAAQQPKTASFAQP